MNSRYGNEKFEKQTSTLLCACTERFSNRFCPKTQYLWSTNQSHPCLFTLWMMCGFQAFADFRVADFWESTVYSKNCTILSLNIICGFELIMCKPSKHLTLDKATYTWPDENIELPMSTTQVSKVKPWLLWIVIP